ncbi:MAG: hypothetical protein AAFY76_10735, partial [Cyanobacteria bacterium J06649_11]
KSLENQTSSLEKLLMERSWGEDILPPNFGGKPPRPHFMSYRTRSANATSYFLLPRSGTSLPL